MLRPLLTEMVKAVVDEPEAVRIEAIKGTDSTELRLYVAPADLGKVIGKQGNTARSMRTILCAASKKLQHRYALDIVKVEQGPEATEHAFDISAEPRRHMVNCHADGAANLLTQ